MTTTTIDLLSALREGIVKSAQLRARGDRHLAEDLCQEGVLVALTVFQSYPDRDAEELVKIAGKAVVNRLTEVVRRKAASPEQEWPEQTVDHPRSGRQDSPPEVAICREFEILLRGQLSRLGNRVLTQKLTPSLKTSKAIQRDAIDNNRKQARITDVLIGRGLGVSKATVCRASSEIRNKAIELDLIARLG